ncbi:MAG TPA: hypothetical protein VFN75_07425 [Pseudonocardiaceae bacterium]|nr:hypothetical protein [Pseudonocardiaceae bacterium]
MDIDQSAKARLERITGLLAGLPGPLGNGELRVWVEHVGRDAMPRAVFDQLQTAGLLVRWYPQIPVDVPETAAEMMSRLDQIDERAAAELFVALTSRTLAYRSRGRYDEAKARELFAALCRLLDRDTIWWTNTDQTGWNPVNRHIFDAMPVATGAQVTVALLAFDED